MRHVLLTDGACHPNPGRMGMGAIILDEKEQVVGQRHVKEGWGTNNSAEAKAFLLGLELAEELGIERLTCLSDSQLLTQQLSGAYKINKPELKELHSLIKRRARGFKYLSIAWHSRETTYGKLADAASRGIKFTNEEPLCLQLDKLQRPKIQATNSSSDEVKQASPKTC